MLYGFQSWLGPTTHKDLNVCFGIWIVYNHTGYSKAGGSSALILNDENGIFAKRISGSDCDITIRQKRAWLKLSSGG